MGNEKPDYIDMIEENLVEAVIAVIFLLAFLGAGLITSYFIELSLLKDIVIVSSIGFGFIALLIKLKKSDIGNIGE